MKTFFRHFVWFGLACVLGTGRLSAASSNWTDVQGATFKGEPQGIYGPFAIFKTGTAKGRRVLLRMLSAEDCVRFHKEIADRPARASDWSKARGSGYDFVDRVDRIENGKLVRAELKGVPEPELYAVMFGSKWEGPSYDLPWQFLPTYNRLRRLYGHEMETVYFGVRQGDDANRDLAVATRMQWLVADFKSQPSMEVFQNFAPTNGLAMVLVTRHGVPLAIQEVGTLQGMKHFIDELSAIMAAADPQNPLFWKDRAHYLTSVRPVQFAEASAPPLLVGNPLRASILRKNKVARLVAKLEIAADGRVASASMANKDEMSPAMAGALEKALRANFVFVPAIDRGKAVAASYDFEYTVPDEKTAMETDRDWVFLSARKEATIPSWLVLRPIPVPASEFSKVDHETADGTMVMTPVVIGQDPVSHRAQMNAFKTDFFEPAGADSVYPFQGQAVEINGNTHRWARVDSKDGFVDLRGNNDCDHSVGYAWAEFEVAEGGPAYFGIGSDDGVKIWLNGKLVHDRWVQRITQIDEDVVPLQLAAGKNTLLIKIQNAKGGWSFFFRLRR